MTQPLHFALVGENIQYSQSPRIFEAIFKHTGLEGQFDLTDNQSKRLEQLKYLLLHCPEAENTIGKFLSKRLPHEQRLQFKRVFNGFDLISEC